MAAAQPPVLQWARAFVNPNPYGPTNYSNGRSVAVDKNGNVYSAGLFQHEIDFDPGPGTFILTASNSFSTGIYISKLNAAGDFVWAIQVPALVEWANIEISVDGFGNVYLAAELRYPTDFDPGPGVYTLTPIGAKDAFVAKYDGNGNLVWAKQFGGPGDTVPASDVLTIDDNNNVIVCGNFNNTVDFDPGPNVFNITSSAHIQSFIVKLNSNGDFIWAKQFGNSPVVLCGSNIADVTCDPQGNIYTVGNFKGLCDFDPGPGVYSLQAISLRDGYIAKLDPNGQFLWAKRIGNTTNDYYEYAESRGIGLDTANNVYTAGNFTGTFDFDPGANTQIITSANYDAYVLKLDAQGNFIWVDAFGSSQMDIGADIAVENSGDVYFIGSVGHITDMDPGPGVFTLTSLGSYGASVLAKFNSNGGLLYAGLFDGTGSTLIRRMVVDSLRNIYIAGAMGGSVDFDPGPNIYQLDAQTEAPIVIKFAKCMNITTSTLNINVCDSYTLNNVVYDSSGVYTQTIPNTSGCDSIITLHLTINKKFTQQTREICEGDLFFAGGGYQNTSGTYVDTLQTVQGCDSIVTTYLNVHPKPSPNLGPDKDLCSNTTITVNPGSFTSYLWQDLSNASSFIINATGLYWVTVTNNFNCTATDTIIVRNLFPAPANFLKEKDSICTHGTLQLSSANAYTKYQWSNGGTERKITVNAPGMYWLMVTDVNGCSGADSIIILPKQCMSGVYIPTAFTPYRDGKNDFFKALVFGKVLSFKLQVFDRAGQIVFQTTDPNKSWDGRYKGMDYSTTVFVWQCFYQLEGQQPGFQKGTVTLIR